MGGPGSGEWYRWDKKETTEDKLQIDIRWLRKNGYLRAGTAGTFSWSRGDEQTGSIGYRMETDRIVLNFRHKPHDGEWEPVEQIIFFDRTPCHFGGYRKWFLCSHCMRCVAIIYGPGKYFLCRHCHDLTYTSRQENDLDRLMRKARNIRRRLGGDYNLMEPFPTKPKGMHWETYWRLWDEAEEAEMLGWRAAGQQFGIYL